MNRLYAIVLIAVAFSRNAYADFDYQFIRVSCIPETGFLEISHQFIHNTAIDLPIKNVYQVFERNGFYSPHKLNVKCNLPENEYRIVTSQAEIHSGMCGATPQITFSLYRNEKLLVQNVVFGYSCFNNPSLNKIYIQDSKKNPTPTEVEICVSDNNSSDKLRKEKCDWFFDTYKNLYEKMFPLDSKKLDSYFK